MASQRCSAAASAVANVVSLLVKSICRAPSCLRSSASSFASAARLCRLASSFSAGNKHICRYTLFLAGPPHCSLTVLFLRGACEENSTPQLGSQFGGSGLQLLRLLPQILLLPLHYSPPSFCREIGLFQIFEQVWYKSEKFDYGAWSN